jgi:two-component system phosphate regulon sensor histidine kinase PhoR
MKRRIFSSTLLAVLLSVLLFGAALTAIIFNFYADREKDELGNRLAIAAAAMERDGDGLPFLEAMKAADASSRFTWVAPDGTVLYDSEKDAAGMENHGTRAEIASAFENGVGASMRFSATLGEETIYQARLLLDGTVLRLSETRRSVYGVLYSLIWLFALAGAAIIALSAVVTRLLTARIVKPVNALNLDDPLGNVVYDEFTPLLRRMAKQQDQLRDYMQSLSARQTEFRAVTDNMTEGLILINPQGGVIFLNRGAERLFRADGAQGKHIFTLNHSITFTNAVEAALAGDGVTDVLSLGARWFQLLASPVKSAGAVILLSDITDRYQAEQSRREFTANVSHELKTPLTNILGYAEVMENGLAPEEKLREFAGCVRDETKRLIQLVGDILRLSALDEGGGGHPPEAFSLLALSRDIARRLAPQAEAAGVTVEVTGEDAVITADRTLTDDMIFNIVDNAVKYNRKDGRVDIAVGKTFVAVKDTGIGIEPKYHERVFDRFFRVDKSHSQRVVGTGLGLSIVKHAAAQLGAKVEMTSEPDVGTRITVRFEG